jgi:tRNA threonylcarbamoyladenosine biosynthesis protein TsaE
MTRSSPRHCALPDAAATARLGAQIAHIVRPGDVIALTGALGAGKTCFARGLIAALARRAGRPVGEVPSPTFTLVQAYPFAGFTVQHFDLYRLARSEDAYELGIEDAFAVDVSLIEWPERLGDLLPAERLEIVFETARGATARRARLIGHGGWHTRLAEIDLER